MSTPVYKKYYFGKNIATTGAAFVTAATINLATDFPSESDAFSTGTIVDLWITDTFVDSDDTSASGRHNVTKWHGIYHVSGGAITPGGGVSLISRRSTNSSNNLVQTTPTSTTSTSTILVQVQSRTAGSTNGKHFVAVEVSVYHLS